MFQIYVNLRDTFGKLLKALMFLDFFMLQFV